MLQAGRLTAAGSGPWSTPSSSQPPRLQRSSHVLLITGNARDTTNCCRVAGRQRLLGKQMTFSANRLGMTVKTVQTADALIFSSHEISVTNCVLFTG